LEAPILVADDQVCLIRSGARLTVRAPETIRGKIEVRAIGIVDVKSAEDAELALVVDLVGASEIERLPDADATTRLLGLDIPLVRLFAWEASAPIKLAVALARAKHA
jgi:serine kinase of HPr protein (carbohydrate metabolism regulator)